MARSGFAARMMDAASAPARGSRQARDDFSAATRRQLAGQVGWLCSNPKCRRLTVAARQGQEGLTSIGVAAHIAAASPGPGAPRYDPSQTSEERRSIENGIWLCQDDAKIIDDDPVTYTVELLQAWKAEAKHRAFLAMSEPAGQAALQEHRPPPTDPAALFGRFLEAARQDLAGFQRDPRWPAHPVALGLRAEGKDGPVRFTARTLAQAASVHERLVLIAPPGTGKSTTLIQLAAEINLAGHQAAIHVPLGEWVVDRPPFLDVPASRDAYRAFTSADVRTLAREGRLRLILDGWNELDDVAKKAAARDVIQLGREFPLLGLVISTRRQALDLPFTGEPLTLEAMDEAQQRDLARSLGGDQALAALDYGWRTPGLSDLTALPLYLTSLIAAVTDGAVYPATKDGVLALMVEASARAAAEELRSGLDGRHDAVLQALAVEMIRSGQTVLTDDAARSVVTAEAARDGAGLNLTATAVLDLLVARHALVRAGSRAVAFQHHQFQEWFASFEVERLMSEADAKRPDTVDALRRLLDDRRWEEPVLFACERLSRRDEAGARAVAATVEDGLSLDPMLAGELIARSAPAVWTAAAPSVERFARAWHRPGEADRGLRFMMTTGRPEFSDVIGPALLAGTNGRHLHVLRLPERLHPSILGADAAGFLSTLEPDHRGEVLAEIADRGGVAGIDFAVEVALSDPQDVIIESLALTLLHRRAERAVDRLLAKASSATLEIVARRWSPDDLADPDLSARLRTARATLEGADAEIERFRSLVYQETLPEAEFARLTALIARPDYPVEKPLGAWLIDRAFTLAPALSAEAMTARMEAGLETPFRIEQRMRGSGVSRDTGPLIDRLLEDAPERHTLHAEALVAGPKTIAVLLERLLAAAPPDEDAERPGREQFWRRHASLIERLGDADWPRLQAAILARPDPEDRASISSLVDVLARALRRDDRLDGAGAPPNRPAVSDALVDRLSRWAMRLLSIGDEGAEDRADLARVIGLADAPLIRAVEAMYVAELKRLERFHALLRDGVRRSLTGQFNTVHTGSFHAPLVQLGDTRTLETLWPWLDTPPVAVAVAAALAALENRLQGRPEPHRHDGYRRLPERLDGLRIAGPSSSLQTRITASVRRLLADSADSGSAHRAAALARTAFSLPHVRDPELIAALLDLPLRLSARLDLLTSMVIAGEVLPVDAVSRTIALFQAEAGPHFHELDRRRHELDQTLALYLFTDAPDALLAALAGLQPFQRTPYAVERTLAALGAAAFGEADAILTALATGDPAFADHHAWRGAVLARTVDSAAEIMLTLVEAGRIQDWRMGGGVQDAGPISEMLRHRPDALGRIWDLYVSTGAPLLRRALVHAGKPEIVTALIQDDASRARPFGYDLKTAVYTIAIAHHPYRDTSAYEIIPVAAQGFRSALFHQALESGAAGVLAAAALDHLDELRDEYGAPQEEPRHPDLSSGRAWPFAASGRPFQPVVPAP